MFFACAAILLMMAGQAAAAAPLGTSEARNSPSRIAPDATPSGARARAGSPRAPPFRTLHTRYPVETLAEAFAEGIYTGHPRMPEFELDPDEINDLLSYLKTLER